MFIKARLPFGRGVRTAFHGGTYQQGKQAGRNTFVFDATTGSPVLAINGGTIQDIGYSNSLGHYVILKTEIAPNIFAYDRYYGLNKPMEYNHIGKPIDAGTTIGEHGNQLVLERFATYNVSSRSVDTRSSLGIDFQEINESAISNNLYSFNSTNQRQGITNQDLLWAEGDGDLSYWRKGKENIGGDLGEVDSSQKILGKGNLFGNSNEQLIVREGRDKIFAFDGGLSSEKVYLGQLSQEWELVAVLGKEGSKGKLAWRNLKRSTNYVVSSWDTWGSDGVSGRILGFQNLSWKSTGAVTQADGSVGIGWEENNGYVGHWGNGSQNQGGVTGRNATGVDIVATGNFDGRGGDDLIALNRTTGRYEVWPELQQSNAYFGGELSSGEEIIGTAFINEDQVADLITQDSRNNVFANFGASRSSRQYLGNQDESAVLL